MTRCPRTSDVPMDETSATATATVLMPGRRAAALVPGTTRTDPASGLPSRCPRRALRWAARRDRQPPLLAVGAVVAIAGDRLAPSRASSSGLGANADDGNIHNLLSN